MTMPQKLELTWFNKDKALIPVEKGRYGYTWVDPQDPRYCETHYLEYVETITGIRAKKIGGGEAFYSKRADLPPTDDNLLILGESGDVLEALTRVPELREKYVGKVKCVYIDPPFNTSQTFANYEDNLEHSVWLTMMRDRLLHLRNLLSDDGSIWVHLDDVENHRMRVLLDEIFGSENFVTEVIWQKADGPRNDANYFSSDHDVILVYRKTAAFVINRLPRTADMNSRFKNPDNDPKGAWAAAQKRMQMMEQKLVEEVHLYCSPLELEEFIQHFCSSFIQKFHEIADLSTFSVEKESDDYNLSSENAGKSNFEDRQNYVLKQKFTCMVHEIDGEPCEEDLDLISDRVFEVVKQSVGSIPYFSFLGFDDDSNEGNQPS